MVGSAPVFPGARLEFYLSQEWDELTGLHRKTAQILAAQTLLGAAKMVLETGLHPGELKDQVTSPNGTTIAAVHSLESSGFRGAVMSAVQAAAQRAEELGRE
jgi:pyrroline-5-carboxylate reductase